MKRLFLFLLIILSLPLTGCSKADLPLQPLCRTVTQVSVTASHNGAVTYHTYTESEKMETMLNYLRLLFPDTSANIEPETFRSDAYRITVNYSDGNHSTYYQIYNDFLKKDDGKWQKIAADQGAALYPILCSMPSDR